MKISRGSWHFRFMRFILPFDEMNKVLAQSDSCTYIKYFLYAVLKAISLIITFTALAGIFLILPLGVLAHIANIIVMDNVLFPVGSIVLSVEGLFAVYCAFTWMYDNTHWFYKNSHDASRIGTLYQLIKTKFDKICVRLTFED